MVGASFSSRCRTASAVHFEASAIRRSAWSARGLAIKFVDQLQLSDEFVGEFSVAVANQSDVVEGDEGLVLQGSPATERISFGDNCIRCGEGNCSASSPEWS